MGVNIIVKQFNELWALVDVCYENVYPILKLRYVYRGGIRKWSINKISNLSSDCEVSGC